MKDQIASMLSSIFMEETKVDQYLHLSACENKISETVKRGIISSLGERYLLNSDQRVGPMVRKGEFQFRPLTRIKELEEKANLCARQMFSAEYCDFRPLSGVHATICSVGSLTEVGDLVLSIDPNDGGHFATQGMVQKFGRRSRYLPWDTARIDLNYEGVRQIAQQEKIKAIILEHGVPMYPIDLKKLRDSVGPETTIIYDASHTLGLISGGEFQNPLMEGADLLQGNTHKSFPGPHKGILLSQSQKIEDKIRGGLDTAFVSSQQTNHSIALFLATLEMGLYGELYAKAMIRNAHQLSESLESQGFKVFRRKDEHTQSHIVLVEMNSDEEAFSACSALYENGISTHARKFFGKVMLRLGVQELTRHGMGEDEMEVLAKLMKGTIHKTQSQTHLQEQKLYLKSFLSHRLEYSFDSILKQTKNERNKPEILGL